MAQRIQSIAKTVKILVQGPKSKGGGYIEGLLANFTTEGDLIGSGQFEQDAQYDKDFTG